MPGMNVRDKPRPYVRRLRTPSPDVPMTDDDFYNTLRLPPTPAHLISPQGYLATVDKKHRFLEFRNRLGVVLNHLSLQELVVVPVVSSVAATVRIFDIGQGDVTGVPSVFAAVKHFRLCTVKPNRPPPTHIKTL